MTVPATAPFPTWSQLMHTAFYRKLRQTDPVRAAYIRILASAERGCGTVLRPNEVSAIASDNAIEQAAVSALEEAGLV